MNAIAKSLPSSPKSINITKSRMSRPISAQSLASDTINLISTAVQAREKQKTSLSIAQQAKLQEEKQNKRKRKMFKKQFYYALKNKIFQTQLFDSARKRITDIPGINVRDNINVHRLHNFQQYFESVNAKAENLVKICSYRTKQNKQAPQQKQNEFVQHSKTQLDLKIQHDSKQLILQSEKMLLKEQDRAKTGIYQTCSEIGNSLDFQEYSPPGYFKKTISMCKKERQKYSLMEGTTMRPKAKSIRYSSLSTTLIYSPKNIKKSEYPSSRSHKYYWSSSTNTINGAAPNTSMWADQKTDTLSSTGIISKARLQRAMSLFNNPQQ